MRKRKAPPGCYWRGNTLWGRVKVRGEDIRWSLDTDDPEIAKARRKAGKDRAVADARHGDARRTFEEAFAAWDAQLERSVGAKTATRYLCSLKQLAPWLEGKGLLDVDGRLVAQIIRERQKADASNATVKRDLVALSSVMNYSIDQGWIENNPVLARMKRVKEAREPIVLPRQTDIDVVRARAPGMIKDMLDAAMAIGAREDELLKVHRDHVDHDRHQITFTFGTKRKRVRTVDLDPFGGYDLLRSLPAYVGSPLLFWHSNGEGYKNFASQFSAIVDRTAEWARENGVDFRPFRFHHLRHWRAIHWLKSGRNIYELQHRLGHASIKTTEVYLRAGYLTLEEQQIAIGVGTPTKTTFSKTAGGRP
jgi:integrase/recombinase XerD